MSADSEWLRACADGEIDDGEAIRLDVEPPVAVFYSDGEYFAVHDTCTHAQSSLSEDGYVDGDIVECGWHSAKFSLRTGSPSAPASKPLRTFPCRLVGGDVMVRVCASSDEKDAS